MSQMRQKEVGGLELVTQQERELLAGIFLLDGLEGAELDQILAHPQCTRAQAAKGEVIYSPHAFQRSLGVILSGSAQVTRDELIVSILEAGDLFGAAALFNQAPDYVTTLTARTDCTMLLLPQSLVSDLMARSPRLTENYIRYLSGRIRFLSDKIQELIAGSAEEKLEQYLLSRAEGNAVHLDCSLTGLAKRLNMSRASLYRAFDALEAGGALCRRGREIVLSGEKRKD